MRLSIVHLRAQQLGKYRVDVAAKVLDDGRVGIISVENDHMCHRFADVAMFRKRVPAEDWARLEAAVLADAARKERSLPLKRTRKNCMFWMRSGDLAKQSSASLTSNRKWETALIFVLWLIGVTLLALIFV